MSAPPDVESAVRAAMRAMFAGDLSALERAAAPHPQLRLLVESRPRVEDLDRAIDEMQMHVIAEQADGRIIVHAFFKGMIMPITLVPQAGAAGGTAAWKADLRWWLWAVQPPREIDRCARAFMYGLISGDAALIAGTSLAHPQSDLLAQSNVPSGELGQYEDVCANMPMTELTVGERYPWPMGQSYTVRPEDVTDDRRILMAQFGGDEITFVMVRVNGKWQVDPSPFVTVAMMRR